MKQISNITACTHSTAYSHYHHTHTHSLTHSFIYSLCTHSIYLVSLYDIVVVLIIIIIIIINIRGFSFIIAYYILCLGSYMLHMHNRHILYMYCIFKCCCKSDWGIKIINIINGESITVILL